MSVEYIFSIAGVFTVAQYIFIIIYLFVPCTNALTRVSMVSVECGSPDESTTAILKLKQYGEPQIAGSSTPTWSALNRTGQFMIDLAKQNWQYVAVQDWGCTIEPTGPNETACFWESHHTIAASQKNIGAHCHMITVCNNIAMTCSLLPPLLFPFVLIIHLNIAALVHQHFGTLLGSNFLQCPRCCNRSPGSSLFGWCIWWLV